MSYALRATIQKVLPGYSDRAGAKTRVFVEYDKTVTEELYPAAYYSLPKDVADKIHTGITMLFARAIAESLQATYEVPEVKVRFSQNAGCSCGCSPGFVVETDLGLARAAIYMKAVRADRQSKG